MAAVAAAESESASGLFLLVWGIAATAFGWTVATDFHGAARRMVQRSAHRGQSIAGLQPVRFVRIVAGFFAVLGPVMLVRGARGLGSDGIGTFFPRLPLGFAVMAMVWSLAGVVVVWRRTRSPLRWAWSGGPSQRAAAVIGTVVGPLLPLSLWTGYGWLSAAIVLVGVAAGVVLLVGSHPRASDQT
ncbi:hypothetical protein U9R90_10735 [Streptomyces sp. E11-3]|uniref:hypothetical protein n=1 Tax=Streptomyces sp. E11-3 TaxID=3110112 RepID=UPI0039819394